ncbi:hypothetical protein D3C85_1826960 [compost metagenome]
MVKPTAMIRYGLKIRIARVRLSKYSAFALLETSIRVYADAFFLKALLMFNVDSINYEVGSFRRLMFFNINIF